MVFLNAALPLEEAKEMLDAGRYQEAYEPLKKAMAMVENPPIGWRRVLASLCLELNKTDEAIEAYKGIVPDDESKEEDYIGLFYAYAIKGDERRALGVLSAAQAAGKLNRESSLTLFSSVLAQNGGAIRAAKLMRRAIGEGRISQSAQNYERLFHLYRQAREYKEALNAIDAALTIEAGEQLYTKCAYTAFEAADYAKAINTAKRALELNATRADNLRLLIGAAAIETKDYKTARSAFGEVLKSRKYGKQARSWLDYLDELTRENSLNI